MIESLREAKKKREVPEARIEDDCVVNFISYIPYMRLMFLCLLFGRIVSNGTSVTLRFQMMMTTDEGATMISRNPRIQTGKWDNVEIV